MHMHAYVCADLMDGWFQYKKLPTNIITRIKHLFDEMDEIYDGKVLTDEIIGVLSRSRRLKEVITVSYHHVYTLSCVYACM